MWQVLSPLSDRSYGRLFTAQVAALVGTGLATVALGLLAHDIAGAQAGEILGAVLAIKMICYVGVAPIANALAVHAPRKTLLVGLDLVRASVAACLPFVGEAWQVYALMTVLFVASAAFTPAFQSMIPDILPAEADYTKALSLSRLASDLESVVSPILAAILLAFISFNDLFAGTAMGFAASALLVLSALIPKTAAPPQRPFLERLTGGMRLFAHTPRLRGVLALSLATAAGGAMAFVNTVVLVQSGFGLGQRESALALAAFGAGSIAAAFALPPLLSRISDRSVLLGGSSIMAMTLVSAVFLASSYGALIAHWIILGAGYSLTLTPIGRVLRRSSSAEDRPALFAAQFALSHACWLIAYPAAGFASAGLGTDAAFVATAALAAIGAMAGAALWPAHEPDSLPHRHDDLSADHKHIADAEPDAAGRVHAHPYVIDPLHPHWPNLK
ncbi:MAG: MFS transporter [Hyphomonadaceae bacterium]|nr:MFS transporter [Hyphomonadaceae bacterium]